MDGGVVVVVEVVDELLTFNACCAPVQSCSGCGGDSYKDDGCGDSYKDDGCGDSFKDGGCGDSYKNGGCGDSFKDGGCGDSLKDGGCGDSYKNGCCGDDFCYGYCEWFWRSLSRPDAIYTFLSYCIVLISVNKMQLKTIFVEKSNIINNKVTTTTTTKATKTTTTK